MTGGIPLRRGEVEPRTLLRSALEPLVTQARN
jgi:hypothetical protein